MSEPLTREQALELQRNEAIKECDAIRAERDKYKIAAAAWEEAHDEVVKEREALKEHNKWMMEKFTAIRRAAGGDSDTMEEIIARVAALRAERDALKVEATDWREKYITATADLSKDIDSLTTECDARCIEVADLTRQVDKLRQSATHWNALYRNCAQEKMDAAARYGQEIVELEHQLAEAQERLGNTVKTSLALFEICDTHAGQVREMGFSEFLDKNPKGCDWCMKAKLAASEQALKVIAGYAQQNGCCPYGCDTPHIAQQALNKEPS